MLTLSRGSSLSAQGPELLQTLANVGAAAGTVALRRAALGRGAAAVAMKGLGKAAATRGALASLGPALWVRFLSRHMSSSCSRCSVQPHPAITARLCLLSGCAWRLQGWLAVDLALKAMGSDHGRVARAVFALAQVRLIRTQGWTQE